MGFNKEHLDLVLVPCGLLILFVYHIVLLYKYLYKPQTTLMGHMNNDKKAWVQSIMEASIIPCFQSLGLSFSS